MTIKLRSDRAFIPRHEHEELRKLALDLNRAADTAALLLKNGGYPAAGESLDQHVKWYPYHRDEWNIIQPDEPTKFCMTCGCNDRGSFQNFIRRLEEERAK